MVKDLRAYNISPHDADHAADLLEAQGAVIARYMNLCRDVLDMDRHDRLAEALAHLAALRKVAEAADLAVEAGAIDEIHLSLVRDAIAEWRKTR